MHEYKEGKVTSPIYSLGEDRSRLVTIGLIVGAAAMAGAFFTALDIKRFFHAYLISFCFFASISLGSLFFVMVQHLTRAGWSVTVRRVAEILAACILPMALLFIPILATVFMGDDVIYKWNSEKWVNESAVHAHKTPYLNSMFFVGRNIFYFVVWIGLAWFLLSRSLKQDESGDEKITSRVQAICAPAMILFVLALVFAAFDWEMSLAPMWFSTMFPVYFFAGAVLSALATITLTCLLLQRSGRITDEVTIENYHDLAKLTFGFIVFWGYIAFSQFMLIWYANIPEETFWYQLRFSNPSWRYVSIFLLVGHLFIPFLGLMARTVRRHKGFLFFAAIFLLAMHWVDHYWLVMPQLSTELGTTADKGYYWSDWYLGVPELLALLGFAGLYIASFCFIAGDRSLVPQKDPRLVEALNFENP